jgi:hypothetical protein
VEGEGSQSKSSVTGKQSRRAHFQGMGPCPETVVIGRFPELRPANGQAKIFLPLFVADQSFFCDSVAAFCAGISIPP